MCQRRLDAGPHPLRGPLPHDLDRVRAGRLRGRPHFVGDLRRQVAHVGAAVGLLGQRLASPERHDGRAEVAHLGAEIVEVVLAGDRVAGRLEDPAQQIAHERAARVADVERSGRVRGYELDVHAVRRCGRNAAPGVRASQDGADDVRERRIRERDVDEPWRGHRHGPDDGAWASSIGPELRGQRLRDPQRRHAARPGQLHREVRREVAVLGVRRAFDLDLGAFVRVDGRQHTAGRRAFPGSLKGGLRARSERHERFGLMRLGHAASRVLRGTECCRKRIRAARAHRSRAKLRWSSTRRRPFRRRPPLSSLLLAGAATGKLPWGSTRSGSMPSGSGERGPCLGCARPLFETAPGAGHG